MKLGASGYLTKQCAGENMWKRFSPFLMEGLFLRHCKKKIFSDATKDNSKLNKPSAGLTIKRTEIEVTTLIALEFSVEKRLANNLFISNNTVENTP
jgi:DNA-binding NarL/FixJ family response regulator